jgi:hypothetical protein
MSIYKRGKIYWYKFIWNGKMVRESTRQPNQNTARQMEGAHRASLAKGEIGIRERKTAPALADFISQRFEPWAEASTSQNVARLLPPWHSNDSEVQASSASPLE